MAELAGQLISAVEGRQPPPHLSSPPSSLPGQQAETYSGERGRCVPPCHSSCRGLAAGCAAGPLASSRCPTPRRGRCSQASLDGVRVAQRRAVEWPCGADSEECDEEGGAPWGGGPGPTTRLSNREDGGRPVRRKRRREAYPSDGDISDEEPYGGGEERLLSYSDDDGAGEEDASDSPAPSALPRCCVASCALRARPRWMTGASGATDAQG